MFTAIITFFSNLFGATKAVSEELTQRDAEENTAPMQANAAAKTDAAIDAKIAAADAAAAKGDLTEAEKLAAE